MAKKSSRILTGMVCEVCNSQNYVTQKNKINEEGNIKLMKYCRYCKKHTSHKEKKKLD